MKSCFIPYSPTIILNGDKFNSFDFILSGDCILVESNFRSGKTYTVTVTQDSIGGRLLNWPVYWKNMDPINSSPSITSRQQVHVHSDGTVAACSIMTLY